MGTISSAFSIKGRTVPATKHGTKQIHPCSICDRMLCSSVHISELLKSITLSKLDLQRE